MLSRIFLGEGQRKTDRVIVVKHLRQNALPLFGNIGQRFDLFILLILGIDITELQAGELHVLRKSALPDRCIFVFDIDPAKIHPALRAVGIVPGALSFAVKANCFRRRNIHFLDRRGHFSLHTEQQSDRSYYAERTPDRHVPIEAEHENLRRHGIGLCLSRCQGLFGRSGVENFHFFSAAVRVIGEQNTDQSLLRQLSV